MIHGHQADVIVVVDLPQFRGNPQIVIAVVRHQLIAPDLVPLAGRRDFRRAQRVDPQPDRRSPRHRVLHKFHVLAVVREQERADCLQSLLGHHFLIRFHFKFRAHRSVRPHNAHNFRARLISQSKMKLRPVDRLLLHQQSRTNLDFAANAKRIDALIAHRLLRVRPHHLPVIVLRSVARRPHRLPVRASDPTRSSRPLPLKSATSNTDRRRRSMFQQREFALFIAKPDHRRPPALLLIAGSDRQPASKHQIQSRRCYPDPRQAAALRPPETPPRSALAQSRVARPALSIRERHAHNRAVRSAPPANPARRRCRCRPHSLPSPSVKFAGNATSRNCPCRSL